MVVLTLITLGNVLTRYFSDRSFAWTEEISVFLIVVLTLAGAASIARRDGHVRIEFFYERGSAPRRRALRLFSAAACVLTFGLLTVLFTVVLADEIRWNETSMGLGVPRWWFTAAVPVLCAAITLRTLQWGWKVWRGAVPGPDEATTAERLEAEGP